MNARTIKLCLIGCGDHASRYHSAPLAHYAGNHPGEICLGGACDVDLARAEAVGEKFGFERAYSDWRKMIEVEKPDGCLAILPAGVTAKVGAELLEMGMPVVLEKPLGIGTADAQRLAEIARRTGTKHMVSMNRRFIPRLNLGVEWARGQSPIRFVRCTMLRNHRTEPDFIWSTGVHAIDALRHIAGDVVGHSVAIRRVDGVAWHFIGLEFAGGCYGEFHSVPTAGMSRESYEMFGDNFMVELETFVADRPQALRCWRDGKLVMEEIAPADEADFIWRGEYAETSAWISALRGMQAAGPDIAMVLPSMELGFEIARQCDASL